jgi:hypothetical protein
MNSETTSLVIGSAAPVAFLILITWHYLNSPGRKIARCIEQIRDGKMPTLPTRSHWKNEIIFDSNGFWVAALIDSREPRVAVKWDAVVATTAFKRDLFSTDRVCIEFRLMNDSCLEVHEEMKGWTEFCDTLPDHLPGALAWTDWFMEITTPAFALKPTPLFRRDGPISTR